MPAPLSTYEVITIVAHLIWREGRAPRSEASDHGGHEVSFAAQDYGIPRAAVDAALAYYRRHQAALDTRIAANAA
jgi:hypothetical protein